MEVHHGLTTMTVVNPLENKKEYNPLCFDPPVVSLAAGWKECTPLCFDLPVALMA